MAKPTIMEMGDLNTATKQYTRWIVVLGEDVTDKVDTERTGLTEGQRVVRIPRETLTQYLEQRDA
jgi:hypothetical protein